jgi:hypothetical protein
MTLEGVTWIVVVNGLVQLAGFVVIIALGVQGHREHREFLRMNRALAGLMYPESEKTGARLDELFGQRSR